MQTITKPSIEQNKPKLPGLSSKELTRLAAINIFYALQFNEAEVEHTINEFLVNETWKLNFLDVEEEIYIATIDEELLRFLVKGAVSNYNEITVYIKGLLTNNKFTYASILLKLVLVMAVFELKNSSLLSTKIVISQYVFVASLFFDEAQVAFVNAVLDQICLDIKKV